MKAKSLAGLESPREEMSRFRRFIRVSLLSCLVLFMVLGVGCSRGNHPANATELIERYMEAFDAQDSTAMVELCTWPASRAPRIEQLMAFRRTHGPVTDRGAIQERAAEEQIEGNPPVSHFLYVQTQDTCATFRFSVVVAVESPMPKLSNVEIYWEIRRPEYQCIDEENRVAS